MSSPLVTVFCCSHPSFQPCLGLRLLGLSLYRPASVCRPSLHPHFPAISAPVHSLPLPSASRALTSGVFFFFLVLLASDWHWSPLGLQELVSWVLFFAIFLFLSLRVLL